MGIRVVQLFTDIAGINRACGLVDVTFGSVIMVQSGDMSVVNETKPRWWLLTYREHQKIDWTAERLT